MFSWRRKAPRERRSKKKSPILISKYRTWNGKRPDETSGLRPQMKTLSVCGRVTREINYMYLCNNHLLNYLPIVVLFFNRYNFGV